MCEYIGEVLDVQEAHRRRERFTFLQDVISFKLPVFIYIFTDLVCINTRYGTENCSYFYDINTRVNDMSRLIEEQVQYVVDATKYGNVSRFINHR